MQDITLSHKDLNLQWESFDGPLDLLLHLIRKRDLDIFDLPIHQIAEEFQAYVEAIQRVDLEKAGGYLELAAELTQIKSRMLLPRVQDSKEDPRAKLVEKVMEYEQVKQLSLQLQDRNLLGRDVFIRGSDLRDEIPELPPETDVTAGELIDIFSALLRRKMQQANQSGPFHQVRRDTVTVRQQISWVCHQLRATRQLRFSRLIEDIWDRSTLIVTFLALLELCRLHHIKLAQVDQEDIMVEAISDLDQIPIDDPASFTYRATPLSEEEQQRLDQEEVLGLSGFTIIEQDQDDDDDDEDLEQDDAYAENEDIEQDDDDFDDFEEDEDLLEDFPNHKKP
ncbi:MAG: segregation/condensation protein A [Myxococcales bacterium]|nr:segregation/condensation protein A [Myxococcales bacterium]MCB9644734.1 segregation/condensation protein A [Myxococcales bacterium]